MKILLTGATGFIGSALATRLADADHAVRAFVRQDTRPDPARRRPDSRLDPRVERLAGQLDDGSLLAQALAQADAVIHVAGTVKAYSARAFRLVNEDLTMRLAEGARDHGREGQIFLHVSSQAAVGPCSEPPGLAESARPAPVSQYGLSKLLGERAVLASLAPERPVAVIRPPMVYGPGDLAFAPLYRLMAQGLLTAPGPAHQPFSIIHVGDLLDGMLLTLDALACGRAAPGSIYHLSGPTAATWAEYAEAFGAALGRRVRPTRVPLPLLGLAAWTNALLHALGLPTSHLTPDKHREARQDGWLLDCSKAKRELGFAPRVDLTAGAANTVAWCRTKGLLGGLG